MMFSKNKMCNRLSIKNPGPNSICSRKYDSSVQWNVKKIYLLDPFKTFMTSSLADEPLIGKRSNSIFFFWPNVPLLGRMHLFLGTEEEDGVHLGAV